MSGADLPLPSFRSPHRRGACGLAIVLLVAAANGWTASYVSAERYVYAWDWASYWLMFQRLGALLQADPWAALVAIRASVAGDESNVLPVVPLMPFAWLFGPGRLSYILAIADIGVLPAAALMALVAERGIPQRSWPRLLACMAGVLGLHVLWAPALRGLPDVVGVVLACLVLHVHGRVPLTAQRPVRLVGIGLLLCLLVLTRRYYLFWAASFLPAAGIAWLVATPRVARTHRAILAATGRLAIVGIACVAGMLILAAPLVGHIATTDYAAAYAAYRADLAGAGVAGQVVDHFGIALLLLCTGGLIWLAVRPATRMLGVLLIVQALLAFALFTHVQTLFGVHHFYLFVPAAGIGLAGAIAGVWDGGGRVIGIVVMFAVVLASAASVFSPMPLGPTPLLPRVRYAPLVRPDLVALERLLARLAALQPAHVYVVASSQLVNGSILAMACRTMQPALCPHIAVTQDIDARDGFPRGILDADYVVLATPTQYHVHPEDQRVVGLLARDIRTGQGIGAAFRRLPGDVALAGGVRVALYRRVAPLPYAAVKALGEELARAHPRMRAVFTAPVTAR